MSPAASSGALSFLAGGGEMAERMRAMDWSQGPLGPPERWPQALRSTLGICVNAAYPIAIYWGPDAILLYNDAWAPILGEKHPWALGRPGREVWSEIWDVVGPLFERVVATGKGEFQSDALLLMRRHGYTEECYFDYTFSPIRGEAGAVEGVFNAVTETTHRVVEQRRLRTLRDLAARPRGVQEVPQTVERVFATLNENPIDVPFALLYLVSEDGATATLLGASANLPAHLAPERVALDRERQTDAWPLATAVRESEALAVDARGISGLPSGHWGTPPEQVVLQPVASAGQVRPAAVLIAGVNPRRALDEAHRTFFALAASHIAGALADAGAHEEARRRAEALAELDRAKTAFFSNVSHELRTPLTLVLGPLEDALSSAHGALPQGAASDLSIAHKNAKRLQRLVNSLLDFSRIEAGRVQASYQPTDLATYTAELAGSFRSAAERAGLRLDADCSALSEPAYIDREMWEKVVFNLLSNAFKHTFKGGITVRVRQLGRSAELSVSDTGVGIPPEAMPRLFERFFRVDGAQSRTHEGSGIGLALVNELVRLHGGAIRAESTPGKGSTFTVTIPLGSSHLPQDRIGVERTQASTAVGVQGFLEEAESWVGGPAPLAAAERAASVYGHGAPSGATVLVVDDNADMRGYVERILSTRHSVVTAGDGEAALEAVQRQKPDLVLTDVMMPRLDGFGLLRALRENEQTAGIPVIMLSARAGEEAKIEGLQKGADDYLVKPFSARELLARVDAQVELARVRAKVEEERARLLDREREFRDEAETLNRIALTVAAELDIHKLVQTVTDHATAATGASFGAFFYNVENEEGESYQLYTLSGVPREAFSNFPMPRATALFGPTFRGEGVIRSPDVLQDPRYGHNAPRKGMPPGHLPVRSYLAAPVISRSGTVLGGLFFGHPQVGIFTERAERLAVGIAALAAVAIDNAALLREARREIGRRVKGEESLRAANERLQRFSSIASHDLKEPLRGIAHQAGFILMDESIAPEHRERLERIVDRCHRLTGMVNSLLEVARAGVDLTRVPCELGALAERAVESLRDVIRNEKAEVTIEPGLPVVSGDPALVERIFANLIGNAIRYNDSSPKIIRIGAVDGEIFIRDNGIGIDPRHHESIFEMFKRGSGKDRGGAGVGLALVKKIVEEHAGSVRVDSAPGKGSTFYFRIPLHETPVPAPQAEAR